MKYLCATATIGFLTMATAAHAGQSDTFHITNAEKAACMSDAVTLCSSAYPDEHRLLSCMRSNRRSLSAECGIVFDAGLKRRHMSVATR